MVRGLKNFQEFFHGYEKAFVVIGGAACEEWFSSQGMRFRATKDIDMVLILEALSTEFLQHFQEYIRLAGYKSIIRSTGKQCYYRFTNPANKNYPVMIELFSRRPMEIELASGQNIVPIRTDDDISSLSAILMDDAYYSIIMESRDEVNGLSVITPGGLLALKAKAWLDLSRRRNQGEKVDRHDIVKHRNDVFRLAMLLPAGSTYELPDSVFDDLAEFLAAFPEDSTDWAAISSALKAAGLIFKVSDLLQNIRAYFKFE